MIGRIAVFGLLALMALPADVFAWDTPVSPYWSWVVSPASIDRRTWQAEKGTVPAKLEVPPTLFGPAQNALNCDGQRQSGLAAADVSTINLPVNRVTLEAWVAVRSPATWGGFISAIQDNGAFERGCLLGYRDSRFCLAIATEHAGKLTYLTADADFTPGSWHHVVGTYDGQQMRIYVDGQQRGSSAEQQGDILFPSSGVLALCAYRDDDEFFRLDGMVHRLAIFNEVLSADQIRAHYENTKDALPKLPSLTDNGKDADYILGPFITCLDVSNWLVEWKTDQASTGYVEVGPTEYELQRVAGDGPPATDHQVLVRDLPRDRIHKLRVGGARDNGEDFHTRLYDFDTMLHYPPPGQTPIHENPRNVYFEVADLAIRSAGVKQGYAFVVDGTGELARALAARSRLQIVVVQPDEAIATRAREMLHEAGLYGTRVTVQSRQLNEMSYGPFLGNIVISDPVRWQQTRDRVSCRALYEILKPAGGVMIVGGKTSGASGAEQGWSRDDADAWSQQAVSDGDRKEWQKRDFGQFLVVHRGKLPGAGEWTHQYALPNNTSCSQDDLIRGDLSVLWWGRPGPRPMPDRGPRNPAPVSANGRLYVQGNRTLFGIDSYNGTILWFQQIPSMRRANIPRDGSNMVATDDYLYLALDGHCVGFAGQTGERELVFAVPGGTAGKQHEFNWGLVACHDQTLFGSAVKRGAQYQGDAGEWYEDFNDGQISRVTSAYLFALDRQSGELLWRYDRGAIINSTFSLDGKAVYFVESRSKQATESDTSRMLREVLQDQYLVALDLSTGELLWDKPVDLSQCEYMTYMSVANDTLIVAGTDKQKRFHTFAFGALSGSELWRNTTQTNKKHHSGHLSHPLVIDDKVFVNKQTLDLKTGNVIDQDLDFDWHGCGVTSASLHTIFRRFEYHGMLDLETNKRTEFLGVRSGCWLSIIPSGGTVLAPETSAGCSCTHAVQTSLAYVPRYLLPAAVSKDEDAD